MMEFEMPLVIAVDGEALTTTDVIAKGVRQAHATVIKLARSYQRELSKLGRVRFEIQPFTTRGGTQRREVALLNEHQAALLISLMRNTNKVVDFKVGLICEFFRMRDELGRRDRDLWSQMQALIAKEVDSKIRASFGSHLMLERKRQIPYLNDERKNLERQIQPSLLTH